MTASTSAAVEGRFGWGEMFGISALFGLSTISATARSVLQPAEVGIPYHPPMPATIEIDRATARRFMVARHLLAPPRSLPGEPASVLRVVDRLGSLQFDPLDVTGRNHDLVLAARIRGYRREWTDELLYGSRTLYETYNKGLSIVPTRGLPWDRIAWDLSSADHTGTTFDEHAPLVGELLDRIRKDGPLSSTDVAPRAAIDWYW